MSLSGAQGHKATHFSDGNMLENTAQTVTCLKKGMKGKRRQDTQRQTKEIVYAFNMAT